MALALLRLRSENPSNGRREPPPPRALFDKLFSPGLGQSIEASFAVVCGSPPARRNPSLRLQALERGIKSAVFDQQRIFRCLLNDPRDALPVLRAEYQRAQDDQVQRALQHPQPFFFLSATHPPHPYPPSRTLPNQTH